MKLRGIINILGFWNKPRYHRDIIKHFLCNKNDSRRLAFYKSFVHAGDLVFDVGANMGNRSKIFLEIGANVIAFEPQPYCSEFLSTAFRGIREFTLIKSALSDIKAQATMHVSNTHTLSTIDIDWLNRMHEGGRFHDQKWDKQVPVHTITLEQAIREHGIPSFIKIDVEGHELNVIKGLFQPIKFISLEFASESLDRTFMCLDHLDTIAKYQYRVSFSESMVLSGQQWLNSDEIKQTLLESKEQDPMTWGDVYAQFVPMAH